MVRSTSSRARRRLGFSTGLEGEVDEGSDAVRAQQVDAEDRHQDDRRLDLPLSVPFCKLILGRRVGLDDVAAVS